MIAAIPFDVDSVDNCSDSTFIIISTATELCNAYLDSLKNKFDSAYAAKCLSAYKLEKFTVKHLASEFHYTLYYYDQAGNLVKTVPPQGVHVNRDSLWLDSVRTARRLGQDKLPAHTLATQYRYNTLNQVVAQHSPDGGKTEFWYDRLGRLVLSSNAKQKAAGSGENGRLYSYTLYDELGRITEVGQVSNTTANGAITDSITRNESLLSTWYYTLANRRGQITNTVYDIAYTGFGSPSPLEQRNLRNRVSYTTYTDTATLSSFNNGTFFTYDIHGNVDTLLQHYGNKLVSGLANVMNKNDNGYKKIVYKYDLISGKVNLVAYNPHNIDEFYHRYTYDAENRLTLAETSTDSIHWEKEARYEYYRHGPLARTILGDQQVQGMDYAYTLQGWLKGVNSISLAANFDMGGDGKTGGINQPVAKDEIGFNLNYFTGEYIPINATVDPFPTHTAAAGLASDDNRPLYNGNISSMAVNIKKLIYPGVAAYHYDQLNRITARKSYYGLDQTNNNWNGLTATKSFEEKFSYDANGNILTADRYTGATWGFMDSLTYSYYPGTNKLRRVRDFGYTMYGFNPSDIADQSASDNYTYDEIGNLTGDAQEGITNIKWSVYGKILEIDRTASTYNPVIKIRYGYDAAGNRISKEVQKNGTDTVEYSWYVRDAQGNIMSTYTAVGDTAGIGLNGLTLNIMDQPLYGSSRLGVLTRHSAAEDSWYPFNERSKLRGLKQYELTNHLGNVLATVSDRKTPVQSGSDPTQVDHFDADVQNAFDYYAFGMVMPDRKFTGPGYRYGFNGKENDNEVKGDGNQQDYGMRIYDPRLGRFLSVDPLTNSYPWYTPYQFAGNNPIVAIDLDGLEPFIASNIRGARYPGSIRIYTDVDVKIQIINLSSTEISKGDLYDAASNLKDDLNSLLSGVSRQPNFPMVFTTQNGQLKRLKELSSADLIYNVDFNAHVSVVDSKDQLDNNSIVFAIVDGYYQEKEPAGLAMSRYSRVSSGEAKYFSDYKLKSLGQKLILHEILHNLGLDDIYDPKDYEKVKTRNAMNMLTYADKQLTDFQKVVELFNSALGPWDKLWKAATENKSVENKYTTSVREDLEKFIKDNNIKVKQ